MVTTAHQKASGIDLKNDISVPASAKYTADEKRTTPWSGNVSISKYFLVIFELKKKNFFLNI